MAVVKQRQNNNRRVKIKEKDRKLHAKREKRHKVINKNGVEKTTPNKRAEMDKYIIDDEVVIGMRDLKTPNAKKDKKMVNTKKKKRMKNEMNKIKKQEKEKKKRHKERKKELKMQEKQRNKEIKMQKKKQKEEMKRQAKILTQEQIEELMKKKRRNALIRKKILNIAKWMFLVLIIMGGIIYFLLSPFFNIRKINISGNEKLTQEEIISLSNLNINLNMFKISMNTIEDKIKKNPYVRNVEVKRVLPSTIDIKIAERHESFEMEFGNSFVYLNSQGYMLKIANESNNKPILVGTQTIEEDIKEGNRLCDEDLDRLADILKIMEVIKANEMNNTIHRIDISNKEDYCLVLEDEKKTIHLGTPTKLPTKVLYIKEVLTKTQGEEGEIFVGDEITNTGAVFRKKV